MSASLGAGAAVPRAASLHAADYAASSDDGQRHAKSLRPSRSRTELESFQRSHVRSGRCPPRGPARVVGLALAQVVIYAGTIVGIAVAACVTITRSRARGMPIERACGLAVVSMLVLAGIVVAAIVAVLLAYGAVMNDF